MITESDLLKKRIFDFVLSLILIPVLILPLIVLIFLSTLNLRELGLFSQKRIGQFGEPFMIYKVRTLTQSDLLSCNKETTQLTMFFRKHKLDELPQIFNIFIGNMSFVGPRPDIAGYADQLQGKDRVILKVKPGLTGPATLKYINEEKLLLNQDHPEVYNENIIWKDKVRINREYVEEWSFVSDLKYLIRTLFV